MGSHPIYWGSCGVSSNLLGVMWGHIQFTGGHVGSHPVYWGSCGVSSNLLGVMWDLIQFTVGHEIQFFIL